MMIMARLAANPVIYKKALKLLDEEARFDDPRWWEIRDYVNDNNKHYRSVLMDKKHESAQQRLEREQPIYDQYLKRGYSVSRIAKLTGHSMNTVYCDMDHLGLDLCPVAHYKVVDPKARNVSYFANSREAVKALKIKRSTLFSIGGKGVINGCEVTSSHWVKFNDSWHEV
jgi:hypothetical protein